MSLQQIAWTIAQREFSVFAATLTLQLHLTVGLSVKPENVFAHLCVFASNILLQQNLLALESVMLMCSYLYIVHYCCRLMRPSWMVTMR